MNVQLIQLQGNYPPIGLGYVASILEQQDVDVGILDFGGLGYTTEQLYKHVEEELARKRPDVIGVTCLTPQAHLALGVAKIAKAIRADCNVVLGGPHPTSDPFRTVQDPNVDFIVVGEGERTFSELVKALSGGRPLKGVEGLVYKEDGDVIATPPRPLIENLDELPFPAFHLFPERKLNLRVDAHGLDTRDKYMEVFTSRGCPYECVYCHKMFGRRFRARSPENVLEEVELLYHKFGIREIHIEDDCFNLDIKRAKRILDLLASSGMKLKLRFPNGVRADYVDEELIVKMKEAGAYQVSFGVETASPRIMKLIKKRLDLRRVEEAVKLALKHGLTVRGFFMIGFPGETKEEIWQTIDYAKNLDVHFASISIVTPYPGTELYEIASRRGYIVDRDYSRYFFANAAIETPEFTREEMEEIKKKAEWEFYNHPRRKNVLLPAAEYSKSEVLDLTERVRRTI